MSLPAPFAARWRLSGPPASLEGRLSLDDEAFFAGHYPGRPILPGIYLVEAILQATLRATAIEDARDLREITACRFLAPLLPGDEITARIAIADGDESSSTVEATILCRDTEATRIRLVVAPRSTAPATAGADLLPKLRWEDAAHAARRLDPTAIREVLPHRPPALLVEEALVVASDDGGRPLLIARKGVTLDEPCFLSRATADPPRYPPTLIAESFCQACGLLYFGSSTTSPSIRRGGRVPVLARLVGFRFLGEALPGARLEHRVRLVASMADGAVFAGETLADGRRIAEYDRAVAGTTALSSPPPSP